MKELNDFNKFINDVDKNNLIELLAYLKDQDYEADEIIFFLESFNSIYSDNTNNNIRKRIEDNNTMTKNLIITLNTIPKIKFVRDINECSHIADSLIKINRDDLSGPGYIKDENDRFVLSQIGDYHLNVIGYLDPETMQIYVLFDDIAKSNKDGKDIIIHELSHARQIGYKFYWYIMDVNHFRRIFLEGQATKVEYNFDGEDLILTRLPFFFFDGEFVGAYINDGEIVADWFFDRLNYSYLYFKYEFLLGPEFMDKWSKDPSKKYFSLASKIIDEKYGKGTFIRLYYDTQLILESVYCRMPEALKMLYIENNKAYDILKDIGNKRDKAKKVFSFNPKKCGKFIELDENDANYQKEKEALDDAFFFIDIISTDFKAICTMLEDENYLTKAVVDLEKLMAECIMKDTKDTLSSKGDINKMKERLALYNYYVKNEKFNEPVMSDVQKICNDIEALINNFTLKKTSKTKRRK